MPELKKIFKPKLTSIQAFDGKKELQRKAVDVDDLIRGIMLEFKTQKGWSTRELARRCGLTQQTVATYLTASRSKNSGRIALITHLCAGLNLSVVDLMKMHPVIQEQESEGAWIEEVAQTMKINDLSHATKDKIEEIMILASALDCFEIVVDQALGLLRSMASAQNLTLKEAQKRSVFI